MINKIRNNTISEIDAKKDLNALNKIKNVEIIKYKTRTPGHKKLLNLFNDLLDIILTDKTESESQEDKNENDENENENKNEDENEDNDDDETMSQNEKVKDLNYNLDKIIGKSK